MTRVFVTGATGFVGYHVARVMRAKGLDVRALIREGADAGCLTDLGIETVKGDVRDYDSVWKGMKGCEQVYHIAADYRLWVPDPDTMYATNVRGTTNVMESALRCGVRTVVYTSTCGVLAPAVNGKPTNEDSRPPLSAMVGHYKRSKFLAEDEVRRFVGKGVHVVIVNPTTPIGSMDRKPTPTGKVILDFLNGKMPAFLDTGLNFVDVEDVAIGHWLASERGSSGERYILGHANLRLEAFLKILAEATGMEPPAWKLPYIPVLWAAYVNEGLCRLTGKGAPMIPLTGVRMARHYMFFDCSKAVTQLAMPQNSLELAAEKAIDWYMRNGYVKEGRARKYG